MSREMEATTISPLRFALGAMIGQEDLQKLIKQLNWTFGNRPQVHAAQSCGAHGWGTSESPYLHGIAFRETAAGAVTVFQTNIKILPEVDNIVVGAACEFSGSDTGEVHFTVGGGSATVTCNAAQSDTDRNATIATSSTGTGWQAVTIQVERTAGIADAQLLRFRIQDEAIGAGALPEPLGE